MTLRALSALMLALSVTPAFAQSQAVERSPACLDAGSAACQIALWGEANTAYEQGDLPKTKQILEALLRKPEVARPASEELRARALQLLGAISLSLQDVEGSKQAGRQALAIWQRRAKASETETRLITQLNLAKALTLSQGFSEAESLTLQVLEQLAPASGPSFAQADYLRLGALEVLCSVLAGRNGPADELIRRRQEIVSLLNAQTVAPENRGEHRLAQARAVGNLGDAYLWSNQFELARASIVQAENLVRSMSLPDSDLNLVLMRTRWLSLLYASEDRCATAAMAARILPFAEPLGQRFVSQILIQNGENYRRFGATRAAASLWARATALELAMACPNAPSPHAPSPRETAASTCVGSSVLIDHLRKVGMSLRYEGQGRAPAGYRSLVQAGDLLKARTLGGFVLNRDASNTYAASRDIFRDQITTAWAINAPNGAAKPVEVVWNCPS